MWLSLLLYSASANAAITVLGLQPLGAKATGTATGDAATYTGSAAYDPTMLNIPPLPNPAPNLEFDIVLDGTNGASLEHPSPFFGFSVEMSISDTILGVNGSFLNVPFLNAASAITQRSGALHIRVGGNSQEGAVLVDSTPNGKVITKGTDEALLTGTTKTPPLLFTNELIHMMANISSLLPIKWYLGIPFNDTNYRLAIVDHAQAILGDNLLGLQAGNEPDFYVQFGRRKAPWGVSDYFNEIGNLTQMMQDPQYNESKTKLIVPSIATNWNPQDVWNTGLLDTYNANIKYVAMERYPENNCAAQFGSDPTQIIDPNTLFPKFMSHQHPVGLVAPYVGYAAFATSKGKPFVMFETNTASCGGFHGLSNSFGGGLWIMDYGLQMAYGNLTQALLHVGGQQAYYNPFTPPPTNQSSFHQWTMGPALYATVIMGEVIGPSGKARVKETFANDNNEFTPSYVIYENEQPVRVALINYMSDNTGTHDYYANIAWPQGVAVPSQVKVKYFRGDSVSVIGNYTWAGQTFGGNFESDGRLMGDVVVETVTCQNGKCRIQVPGPSLALVFLTDDALNESNSQPTKTFATTAATKTHNTATVDPSVLATSNGHSGMEGYEIGSTSPGSRSGAGRISVGLVTIGLMVVGMMTVATRVI